MLDIVEDKKDTDQHLDVDVHVAQHGEDVAGGQQATSLPTSYSAILESENKDISFQLV